MLARFSAPGQGSSIPLPGRFADASGASARADLGSVRADLAPAFRADTSPPRSAMLKLLAPLALLAPFAQQDGPTPVRAVRARAEVVVSRQQVTGSVRPALDARVSARETGTIIGGIPRVGTRVAEGDPLLVLDDRRLRADLARIRASRAQAEAALTRVETDRADAEEDLASLKAASSTGGAISPRELREAQARFDAAEADRLAARASIDALDADASLLDLRIADATVPAPFDGVVVERMAEVGEWAMPGTAVVRLVSTTDLEVWLDVPERLMSGVLGASGGLTVRVPALGAAVELSDVRVLPLVTEGTRNFRVVGRAGETAGLAAGISVNADIQTGEERTWLLVPKDALLYRPTGVMVTLVQGADEGGDSLTGAAVSVPADIAFELDRHVALRPGAVSDGAVVVVEGNERLRPGVTVSATITPGEATDTERIGDDGETPR